jgi:hypothetical protein
VSGVDFVALGKEIFESGKYAPKGGELLGRLDSWGLDIYERSPKEWIDAWVKEELGK